MKMPIEWHEECLRNMNYSLKDKRGVLERAREDFERLERDVITYEFQVELAKKEGKDGFDSEKYAKKRRGAQL